MDYQSTFFLVIAKPSVEYKRGLIFWLPGNIVPEISTEQESQGFCVQSALDYKHSPLYLDIEHESH